MDCEDFFWRVYNGGGFAVAEVCGIFVCVIILGRGTGL